MRSATASRWSTTRKARYACSPRTARSSTGSSSFTAAASSARPATRCLPNSRASWKPCAARWKSRRRSRRATTLPEHQKMQFRVGVNLGDVVVNNNDLLGDGVNVAARLETIAEPGGICISSSVYDQITGKLDLGFQDIGEQALKNISRPIRVYRVSGAGVPQRPAPLAPPAPRARSLFPWVSGATIISRSRESSRGRPDGCLSARPTAAAGCLRRRPSRRRHPRQRRRKAKRTRSGCRLMSRSSKRKLTQRVPAPMLTLFAPPKPKRTRKRGQTGYGHRRRPMLREFAVKPKPLVRAQRGADAVAATTSPAGRQGPRALPQAQPPRIPNSTAHGAFQSLANPSRAPWATNSISLRR